LQLKERDYYYTQQDGGREDVKIERETERVNKQSERANTKGFLRH
jgi:hypothetical protein